MTINPAMWLQKDREDSIQSDKPSLGDASVINAIKCPNCHSSIEITQVISVQISAQIRSDVENEVATRRRDIEKLAEQIDQREVELRSRFEQIGLEVAN